MPTPSRASFLDAYLVATDSMGTPPVGVVRKDRNVWRAMRFGAPGDTWLPEVFASRAEAATRLLEPLSPTEHR